MVRPADGDGFLDVFDDLRPRPSRSFASGPTSSRSSRGGALAEATRALVRRALSVPQGEDAELPREPGSRVLPLLRMQGAGSAIDFLIKHEGYTFPEAVRALAERAGIAVEERGTTRRSPSPIARRRRARSSMRSTRSRRRSSRSSCAATSIARTRSKSSRSAASCPARTQDRQGAPGVPHRLRAARVGRARELLAGARRLAGRRRDRRPPRSALERLGLLRSLSPSPHVRGDGRAGPRRRLQRPRASRSAERTSARSTALSRARPFGTWRRTDGGPPPKYINTPESAIYTKGQMLFGIHQARHAIRQQERRSSSRATSTSSRSTRAGSQRRCAARHGVHRRAGQAPQALRAQRHLPVRRRRARDEGGPRLPRGNRSAGSARASRRSPKGSIPTSCRGRRAQRAVEELVASGAGHGRGAHRDGARCHVRPGRRFERVERVERIRKLIGDEEDAIGPDGALRLGRSGGLGAARSARDARRSGRRPQSGPFAALQKSLRRDEAGGRARGEVPGRRPRRMPASRSRSRGRRSDGRWWVPHRVPEAPRRPRGDRGAGDPRGPAVMAIASLRRAWKPQEKTLNVDAFLREIPPAVRAFANKHLANPQQENESEAKRTC